MAIANIIAFILVLIGGFNWGLVGLFNFNLVAAISMGSRTVERLIYILVLVATIWLIIASIIDGAIYFGANPFANNTTPTV